MALIVKNDVIEIKADTVEFLRTKYGLNGPGRIEEAVSILDEWIRLQPHFKKKDFPKQYLESFIFGSKGSIERAKMRLDKLCTLRTLLPQFFGRVNVKDDFGNFFDHISAAMMPKCTKDHYRIYMEKIYNDKFTSTDFLNYFRFSIALCEYNKLHNYMDGMIFIVDLTDVNILEYLNRLDLVIIRQAYPILLDCYTLRLKSAHIITESKLVSALVSFVKQFVSPKVGSRIFTHKSISELYDVVDKKLLPKDYGGEEKSIRELKDTWIKVLSSEEHVEHLANISTATTDETLRRNDQFNEEYAGIPGTFRVLEVD